MKQKIFLLSLCLLSGSAFATQFISAEINNPATGAKTCTFSFNGTSWRISIPTELHGTQNMDGSLEQMAQVANNLNQAKICAF